MFARPKSFSVLYGIQRIFLNVFYLISVVAVFWLIFYFLHDILQAGGRVIIPVSLAYLIIIVLGYSIMQVISYIPANLAGAFDPLKNAISDGSISSGPEFAGKLADFMCSFFNFAFFDVRSALVRLEGEEPVSSSDFNLLDAGIEPGKLKEFGDTLNETKYYRKIITVQGSFFVYVTPLIFGERKLGYIAVATRHRLWNIFLQLLNEFENDYVDDQVVHILAREANTLG